MWCNSDTSVVGKGRRRTEQQIVKSEHGSSSSSFITNHWLLIIKLGYELTLEWENYLQGLTQNKHIT